MLEICSLNYCTTVRSVHRKYRNMVAKGYLCPSIYGYSAQGRTSLIPFRQFVTFVFTLILIIIIVATAVAIIDRLYVGLFESVFARMILDARVAEEFKATTIIAVIVALVCAKR